jgi:hypothetical protein
VYAAGYVLLARTLLSPAPPRDGGAPAPSGPGSARGAALPPEPFVASEDAIPCSPARSPEPKPELLRVARAAGASPAARRRAVARSLPGGATRLRQVGGGRRAGPAVCGRGLQRERLRRWGPAGRACGAGAV